MFTTVVVEPGATVSRAESGSLLLTAPGGNGGVPNREEPR